MPDPPTRRLLAFGALAVAVTAAPLSAQAYRPPPGRETSVTLSGGLGVSTLGIFGGLQMGFHRADRDWIVRGTANRDFEIFSERDAAMGLAVLRGWRHDATEGSSWRRLAVGVSADYVEIYSEDESDTCSLFGCPRTLDEKWGIGLALQGDIGLGIGDVFGVSVTGQGSLNTAKSWFAAGILLTIGRMSRAR